MRSTLRTAFQFLRPFGNPLRFIRSFAVYPRYLKDWRSYSVMPDSETLKLSNASPQLHERTSTTSVGYHYFYTNGWAMRRIVAQRPAGHVDIGSQTMFVNLLSAVLPVTFFDYRPLGARMEGLTNRSGDILNLPLDNGSIESLSCLHVAEHIGLGRYGEPLNPHGTRMACNELKRILAAGGNLYFALPIGKPVYALMPTVRWTHLSRQ